jgi:SlyX protein
MIRRIEELESQAAFQDELHETLNTIVAKQDREILELKRQLGMLNDRLKEISEAAPGHASGPAEEIPPHY